MVKTLNQVLKNEEKIAFTLRGIYEQYGYRRFKMGKFEEYDFYSANKDFLQSGNIITFTDTNGKLMALKPDVTLSIINNFKEESDGSLQKVYYNENIYRVSRDTNTYKELLQVGIECIGEIDLCCESEVILLAKKSLEAVSPNNILSLSHMGIINILVENLKLNPVAEKQLFKYVGEKNIHGIESLCETYKVSKENSSPLLNLLSCYGSAITVIKKLKAFTFTEEICGYINELETICTFMGDGTSSVEIDFSVVNDMSYYNGIVFQGFISGIPTAVISGGRYDKLLEKMGKSCGGIGFAFYMNLLDYINFTSRKFDVDVLLLYEDASQTSEVLKEADSLIFSGNTVQIQKNKPTNLKYKKLMLLKNGRLETLESND